MTLFTYSLNVQINGMKSRKLENVNNLHMASNRAQYPWWPQHLVSNTCSPVISFKVPVRMFFASYLSTCIILHSQCTFNTMIRTYVLYPHFPPHFNHTFQLLQPSDLSSLPDGRSIACPIRMSLLYFRYIIFITYAVCVSIFMTSPLGVAVGLLSI